MIGNQKDNDSFVTVATKVPRSVADLLNVLAKMRGMEVYELLQLLVNGFIASAKHNGPVTPDIRMLLESLKTDTAFCQAFNFSSPTAVSEIAQMVLILQQPGKKGFGLVMIDRPFMSDARMTYCVDDILERVAEVSMKGLYRELRQVGISLDSRSLRETLILLCDAQAIASLSDDLHSEGPQMGNFSDFGRAIEYGQRTRQKKRRTPDGEANRQQRIQFTDEDRELAEQEVSRDLMGELSTGHALDDDLESEMGFRPFDQEW